MKKKHFIFPGQGSQSIGMTSDLLETSIAKNIFEKTNNAIGYDLLDVCKNGPEEILSKTKNTQPAIFTLSVIIDSLLKDSDIYPISVAGHSLGEYSALVSSNVLSFKNALDLIILRSSEMEKANNAHDGSMAAVLNAEIDKIREVIDNVRGVLVVANYNTESQIVISGEKKAIQSAIKEFQQLPGRTKCIELNVSGAFHSPLMKFAREALSNAINVLYFSDATVPIYQNINAKSTTSAAEIKQNLILQLESPVQWSQTINNMIKDSEIQDFIECGPGTVLAGINRRILRNISTDSTGNMEKIKSICTAI